MEVLINKMVDDELSIDMNLLVEAMEETANRVALLCCDDLSVVKEGLDEVESESNRSIDEKITSLMQWMLTDSYREMREELSLVVE